MDRLSANGMPSQQQRDKPPPNPEIALHESVRDGTVRGEHPGLVMPLSAYNRTDRPRF